MDDKEVYLSLHRHIVSDGSGTVREFLTFVDVPEGVTVYIKDYIEGQWCKDNGAEVMPAGVDEAPQVWHDDKGYYSLWGHDETNVGDIYTLSTHRP